MTEAQREDFFNLVKGMRDAQQKWYATHDVTHIRRAKALEKKVDYMIEAETSGQRDMFDGQGG